MDHNSRYIFYIQNYELETAFDLWFRLGRIMVEATMAIYKDSMDIFLPTPSKSHYIFNLRDFARVIRGVLLAPNTHMQVKLETKLK